MRAATRIRSGESARAVRALYVISSASWGYASTVSINYSSRVLRGNGRMSTPLGYNYAFASGYSAVAANATPLLLTQFVAFRPAPENAVMRRKSMVLDRKTEILRRGPS